MIVITGFVLPYFCISFYNVEADFRAWDNWSRGMVLFSWLFLTPITVGVVTEYRRDFK